MYELCDDILNREMLDADPLSGLARKSPQILLPGVVVP